MDVWSPSSLQKTAPVAHCTGCWAGQELAWTLWRNKKSLVLAKNEIIIPWLFSL